MSERDNDKLIEDGIGLIARGLFRFGQSDPDVAYEKGMSVVSVVRDMAFDFRAKSCMKQTKSWRKT